MIVEKPELPPVALPTRAGAHIPTSLSSRVGSARKHGPRRECLPQKDEQNDIRNMSTNLDKVGKAILHV